MSVDQTIKTDSGTYRVYLSAPANEANTPYFILQPFRQGVWQTKLTLKGPTKSYDLQTNIPLEEINKDRLKELIDSLISSSKARKD